MTVEDSRISEYIEFVEKNIVNTEKATVEPARIEIEKHRHIPSGMAKHWIFANNLKVRNREEVNQIKLIFYILALRYLKKYHVRVEPIIGLDVCDEMKQYAPGNDYYVLYLNNNILAMSSKYSLLYTNPELINLHVEHLGLYTRDFDTQNLFSKLNSAEKMLLRSVHTA